jgi:hypothetical protein
VAGVLADGGRTADIARAGEPVWGTRQMADAVIRKIRE